MENKERTKCEVYSRVVGYLRPVQQWNEGKQAEFADRKTFSKEVQQKPESEELDQQPVDLELEEVNQGGK